MKHHEAITVIWLTYLSLITVNTVVGDLSRFVQKTGVHLTHDPVMIHP